VIVGLDVKVDHLEDHPQGMLEVKEVALEVSGHPGGDGDHPGESLEYQSTARTHFASPHAGRVRGSQECKDTSGPGSSVWMGTRRSGEEKRLKRRLAVAEAAD
jgi:hypothetical protein